MRDNKTDEQTHCRTSIYMPFYERVLAEMNKRFEKPKHILLSIAACDPKSENVLNENHS